MTTTDFPASQVEAHNQSTKPIDNTMNKKIMLSLRLPREMSARLRVLAAERDMNVERLITMILNDEAGKGGQN